MSSVLLLLTVEHDSLRIVCWHTFSSVPQHCPCLCPVNALAEACIVCCSRTVRRLTWYFLSAVLCVWSVMMLKHVEVDSTSVLILIGFSVSMPESQHHSKTQCLDTVGMRFLSSWASMRQSYIITQGCHASPNSWLYFQSCSLTRHISISTNLASVFCIYVTCHNYWSDARQLRAWLRTWPLNLKMSNG